MGECLSNSHRQKGISSIAMAQASIPFCQFYVINYLFKQIVELDVVKDSRDQARETIRKLVNARSESEYTTLK